MSGISRRSILFSYAAIATGAVIAGAFRSRRSEPLFEPPAATRTIRHFGGETLVPEFPHRVVVLSHGKDDPLVALGLPPIGAHRANADASDERGCARHLSPHTKDTQVISGQYLNISFESILKTKPDLIIGDSGHIVGYENLSRIAPTLLFDTLLPSVMWDKSIQELGKALNRQDHCSSVISEYRALCAKSASSLRRIVSSPLKVLYARLTPQNVVVSGALGNSIGSVLHGDLKLDCPVAVKNEVSLPISLELFSTLEPDIIFLENSRKEASGFLRELSNLDLWKNIAAVKSNRIHICRGWNQMAWGPIGRSLIVEETVQAMSGFLG